MSRLYRLAALYYHRIEFLPFRLYLRWPIFWILALFLILLGVFFTVFASDKAMRSTSWWFLVIALLEFGIAVSAHKFRGRKQEEIRKRLSERYKRTFLSYEACERFVLRRLFGNSAGYAELCDRIEKTRKLEEQFTGVLDFTFDEVSRMIYDPDSKPRVYALLLVIVSAVVALTVRENAGLSQLLDFYAPAPISQLIGIYVLAVVGIAEFMFFLLILRRLLRHGWAWLNLSVCFRASRNRYALNYVHADLAKLARFTKPPASKRLTTM